MDLIDDILQIIINYTYGELYLVNRRFKHVIDKLLPQLRKLIPLNTDKLEYYLLPRDNSFYPDDIVCGCYHNKTYNICLTKSGTMPLVNIHTGERLNFHCISNIIYFWKVCSYSICLDNIGNVYHTGLKRILKQLCLY